MLSLRRSLLLARGQRLARPLSSRASTILASLDISTSQDVPGVYDGQWGGTGDVYESVCPTTGETLARIHSVSPVRV